MLKPLHWFFIVGGVVATASFVTVGAVLLGGVGALDTSRSLKDFESNEAARHFVSEHLPVALPNDAVVSELAYERWTDWRLSATVKLDSGQAAEEFVARVLQDRKTDDPYCGEAEPERGARYFLSASFACGTVSRGAAHDTLEILCHTR